MAIHGTSPLTYRPIAAPATTQAARPAASRPAAQAAPAAPADGSLWEMLTAEERDFFAQQASLGNITYGRGAQAAGAAKAQAPMGQRLDVRG